MTAVIIQWQLWSVSDSRDQSVTAVTRQWQPCSVSDKCDQSMTSVICQWQVWSANNSYAQPLTAVISQWQLWSANDRETAVRQALWLVRERCRNQPAAAHHQPWETNGEAWKETLRKCRHSRSTNPLIYIWRPRGKACNSQTLQRTERILSLPWKPGSYCATIMVKKPFPASSITEVFPPRWTHANIISFLPGIMVLVKKFLLGVVPSGSNEKGSKDWYKVWARIREYSFWRRRKNRPIKQYICGSLAVFCERFATSCVCHVLKWNKTNWST